MDDKGLDGLSVLEKAINERELQTLKVNHSLLQEFSDSLKKQLEKTEDELQKSRQEYSEVLQSKDLTDTKMRVLGEENSNLKNNKMELLQIVDRKNDEILRLKSTISNIESSGLRSDLDLSLTSSINEIQLKEIKFNFEENRFNHERNLYKNQINLLNEDLEAKSNELLNLRKETNMSQMQANVKMNQQSNEINSLHLEINRLKAINESKEKCNSELTKKHLDLQLECTKLESIKSKESDAQNDIINLLMKRNEDLQNHLTGKDTDINDLRDIIQKGREAHDDMEASITTMKESFLSDLKQLEMERDKYAEELEQTKLRFSEFNKQCIEKEFERHFPVAYQNNQQLNMLSMSDLYQLMIDVKKENSLLVAKNAQLEKNIVALEYKLNEEKPVLYKNLQDYDYLTTKYSMLEDNVFTLIKEKEKLLSEKDDDIRDINTLKREINRYDVENKQLSLQIQYLLRNVHESSGYNMQEQSTVPHSDQFDIPLNLITFKDIQALQDKNRELLQLMHRLSEELDNSPLSKDDRLVNLKNENDEIRRENQSLKSELTQKNDLLNNQTLLSINESIDLNSTEIAMQNREFKDKIEKYQIEIDSTRKQHVDDIRRLEKEKNSIIGENSSLKFEVSKISSELEGKSHYLDNVTMQLEQYQSENTSLRERNIKLNANVENLEKSVIIVKSEIDSMKEAVKLSEKNLHLAQCERDLFKNNEATLANECAILKHELDNHKQLVYSLRAAQENLTRMENESVRTLQAQLDNLQKSNNYYREKVDKLEEKWKTAVNDFSIKINNLQILLDKEKTNSIELQQKYYDAQNRLQQQIEKPTVSNDTSLATSGANFGDHRKQLINLQDEIKVLKGKLVNSDSTCENLKAMNHSLEENLAKLINNNKEIKVNIDLEIHNKQVLIQELQQKLEATCKDCEEIVAQKDNIILQTNERTNILHSQIEQLKQELISSKEATLKAEENAEKFLDDLKYQTAIADKALEDYESESGLRSGDANTIFELQLKVKDLEKMILEKESELNKLKEETTMNCDLWNTQRKSLSEGSETLKLRCSSLESTNESLLSQIDLLSNQVIALQNNSNLFMLDEESQKENSNQLLNVIKFLREEKSQLQSKVTKLSDEHMCLSIEINNYKKEVENLRNSLEFEKQSTNRLTNISEFNDLLSKAEIVPTLTENNSQMRMEIIRLEKRCSELLNKLANYDSNDKVVQSLANKAEEDLAEKQVLRNEIEEWKIKAKNCDVESLKRLQKQLQLAQVERNKLKQTIDSLSSQMKKEAEEKDKIATEKEIFKGQVIQLRKLAKAYKEKVEQNEKSAVTTSDKEVQSETSMPVLGDLNQQGNRQLLEDLQAKLEQKDIEIRNFSAEIGQLERENDSLKKSVSYKEDRLKNLAEKTKARLEENINEKRTLLKDKEDLTKQNEGLKNDITNLQTEIRQKLEQVKLIKQQYDSKEKELQLANRQIENLTIHLQQPSAASSSPSASVVVSSQLSVSSVPPTSTSATCSTSFALHPQAQSQPNISQAIMQAIKTTPTASIKPLTVAASRSPRTTSQGHRPVTMVQPTANIEEQVTAVATVQPTQPLAIPSVAVSSSVPSSLPSLIEISEASTSQNLNQSNVPPFVIVPSTSGVSSNPAEKRSYDISDEPTSSQSKKIKTFNLAETSNLRTDEDSREVEITEMEESNPNETDDNMHHENVQELEDVSEVVDVPQDDISTSNDQINEEEGSDLEEDIEEEYEAQQRSDDDSNDDSSDEEHEVEEEDEEDVFVEEMGEEYDDSHEGLDDVDEEEEEESDEDSEIEVIAIDDSDDEEPNSNPSGGHVRDEVTSSHASHVSHARSSEVSGDLTTTTNDDATESQTDQPSNSGDVADSEQDKQEVISQSSYRFAANEQANVSEIASSTSAANLSSSGNQRRPVTWPQNTDANSPNSATRPSAQPGQNVRRQLHVRGTRMPMRRAGNARMPRRGNYRF